MADIPDDVSAHVQDDDGPFGDPTADDERTHLFLPRDLAALRGALAGQRQARPVTRQGTPGQGAGLAPGGPGPSGWRTLLDGDLIARRYRIGEQSRRTGRIITVAARHLELDQAVALTYLSEEASRDAAVVAQFLRDARLVSRVPSSRTARVLDIGRLVFGSPFAVLEQPPGWTFSEVLRVRGRLPLSEAVDYVSQACRAIAEAHAAGLRRVGANMSNLILTRESSGLPLVKTILFGAETAARTEVVRAGFSADDELDEESLIPYVAPEDIRDPEGQDGARADVWSLGAVLYELYTGAPAFSGSTAAGLLARIVADSPLDVRSLRPESPAEMRTVIERCLAKDPSQRYRSCSELAEALSSLEDDEDVPPASSFVSRQSLRPPPLPSFAPTARTIVASARAIGRPKRPWARDRSLALAAGVALGILGLAGFNAARHTPAATSSSADDSSDVAAARRADRGEEPNRPEEQPAVPPTLESQSSAPAPAHPGESPAASVTPPKGAGHPAPSPEGVALARASQGRADDAFAVATPSPAPPSARASSRTERTAALASLSPARAVPARPEGAPVHGRRATESRTETTTNAATDLFDVPR